VRGSGFCNFFGEEKGGGGNRKEKKGFRTGNMIWFGGREKKRDG